jgi:hypothetical protein
MRHCRGLIALIAGAVIALPAALSAQPGPSSKTPRAKQQRTQPQPEPEYEVEELTPDQIRRAQEPQTPAQRNNVPSRNAAPAAPAATTTPPNPAAAPAMRAEPAGTARSIACNGVWSKDASHIKLANTFKLDNVVFTDVEGPGSTKVMATVVFPKDPKRRLEVWWNNQTSRSGLHLIVINGQSTWSVPKGLKLGLGLAAIEKLNGKPFKLKGFDKDGGNTTDWDGGALGALPGGCRVGLKFAPDPKAPQAARDEVMVDREFDSTDPAMRAARPSIAEIILGY